MYAEKRQKKGEVPSPKDKKKGIIIGKRRGKDSGEVGQRTNNDIIKCDR